MDRWSGAESRTVDRPVRNHGALGAYGPYSPLTACPGDGFRLPNTAKTTVRSMLRAAVIAVRARFRDMELL
ncbi:hypothetical protein [Streptomyces sp. NPDC057582]|uniref:hypothetical protein n=1 Tax=Streptomyces sp. NPDC057582 TaxID=3346174 RepID=UPI003694EEE9